MTTPRMPSDTDPYTPGVGVGPIHLLAGSADYHTLVFQSRTDLERKSRVEIE